MRGEERRNVLAGGGGGGGMGDLLSVLIERASSRSSRFESNESIYT